MNYCQLTSDALLVHVPFPTQCFQHISPLTNIRLASDGSFLHSQGFQGWLIAKLDNVVLIQGFGAKDGCIKDVSSYRAEICGNIATFTVFSLLRKVYCFSPPSIEHVCDNQSAISATWKDKNISVFDKTKPDANVAKVARNAIVEIQQHSQVNAFWVEGHADKCGPPFSPQEELNILIDGLAAKAQTNLPTEMKPRSDCLHLPEQQVSILIQKEKSHHDFHTTSQMLYTD
jgi:ribonuclease HI